MGVLGRTTSITLAAKASKQKKTIGMMNKTILVTGGAGFIGSNFVYNWIRNVGSKIVNLDKLTYAGNPANLKSLELDSRYIFVQGDICDASLVRSILAEHEPGAIIHLAAETHVDRSIYTPDEFIRTNVYGTFILLQEAKNYWDALADPATAAQMPFSAQELAFLEQIFGQLKKIKA